MAASATSPADPSGGRPVRGSAFPPKSIERIVLTGFMGSGKSTVGRLIAEKLGWTFSDLDTCIEKLEGMSVPQIFASHGERMFRAAEVRVLRELLSGSLQVIALGGGAPGTPALQDLLAASRFTVVVHLHAPFPVLYGRCRAQALDPAYTDRPLLGDEVTTADRYRERLDLYRAVAHWTADAEAGPPEVVAAEILRQLEQRSAT